MGNVILCVGSYAETPYYLERSGVRIFCIEELCFFLRENSLLLDPEIMKPELAEWVKLECALPELAKEMKRYLKEKRTINEYVNLIMKGAHYCTESEWKEIDRLITESKNWNSNERMKGRTDYHFQNGKYLYALRAYEALYHDLKQEDPLLAAKVLHNPALSDTFCSQPRRLVCSLSRHPDHRPVYNTMLQFQIRTALHKPFPDYAELWLQGEGPLALDHGRVPHML